MRIKVLICALMLTLTSLPGMASAKNTSDEQLRACLAELGVEVALAEHTVPVVFLTYKAAVVDDVDPLGGLGGCVFFALARARVESYDVVNVHGTEKSRIRFHSGSYPVRVTRVVYLEADAAEDGGRVLEAERAHEIRAEV